MELSTALEFARTTKDGVLASIKRDGRPQLSNIFYAVFPDDTIRVSITTTRKKYKNLVRDPRGSLWVPGDDFWTYVVIDGDVTFTTPPTSPDDPVIENLIELRTTMSGPEDDWVAYRQRMFDEQRVVLTLHPTHAYGTPARNR